LKIRTARERAQKGDERKGREERRPTSREGTNRGAAMKAVRPILEQK